MTEQNTELQQPSVSNESNYVTIGDYELEQLSITTNTDKPLEIDISRLMSEINLYESIYNQFITGNIMMVDSNGLDVIYGLGEGERITLIFKTKTTTEPIEFRGIVYKKEGPFRLTEHSGYMVLHFASEEFITSNRTIHHEAYKGSITDTVEELLKKVERLENPKPLETTPTKNIEHVVFPGYTTLKALDYCTRVAVSDNSEYGYVFYEDNKKFNFKPLEALYTQEPVIEYNYTNSGVFADHDVASTSDGYGTDTSQPAVKSPQEQAFNAYQEFDDKGIQSYLDTILDGQYGSTWMTLNLREKELDTIQYKIDNTSKKDTQLGEHGKLLDRDYNEEYTDRVSLTYNSHRSERPYSEVHNHLKLLKSETSVINLTLPGNSELKVGEVCVVNIPQWNAMNFDPEVDELQILTGKYLISEIRHRIDHIGYVQYIKVIKDSFNRTLG